MHADTVAALAIVAVSGRALARSALRGGWRSTVIDCFADVDTRSMASACVRVSCEDGGLDATQVLQALEAHTGADTAVVYGGGMERHPDLIERIAARRTLHGNSAASLRTVGDPEQFFPLLDRLGIAHPPTRSDPPGEGGDWLCKRKRACGGGHVRRWCAGMGRGDGESYYQAFVHGAPMSVLFVADGSRAQMIGTNLQWTARLPGDPSFRYGGAVAHAPIAQLHARVLERSIAALTAALGLRGMNSLDFIAAADGPQVIELNPRPGATFELYDADVRHGLLALHLAACAGELPKRIPWGRKRVRAHGILYAQRSLVIPPAVRWPDWISDRPAAGERIETGRPVCGISATGLDATHARQMLQIRQTDVEHWLLESSALASSCG